MAWLCLGGNLAIAKQRTWYVFIFRAVFNLHAAQIIAARHVFFCKSHARQWLRADSSLSSCGHQRQSIPAFLSHVFSWFCAG